MNRFRTKKKAKEAPEALARGSTDSDIPPVPVLKTSKSFGFGKKQPIPEPKVELDLSTALPSSDDFRTSLLMSGLSARFSMLREQDDPNSKIGKASDDSVLFPSKRQSRMADFGFSPRGLADIAEVSSISGSIRPPFAQSRVDSYGSTGSYYGVDDDSVHAGSIMNRAKPGEGNNLFGGRQKIYKIAAGSSKASGDGAGSGMGGRALYENDVSQSAFQKLREREKEQQQIERDREDAEQDLTNSRSDSPPPSNYNRNRETTSTTSSGGPSITRSSTAATSIHSQRTPSLNSHHGPVTNSANAVSNGPGGERIVAKTRRLYDTGLDQHLHEQQHSAMTRIDTLTRQRTFGPQSPPGGLSSPNGIVYPIDRWAVSDRREILNKSSMPNMRTQSPSPTVANGHFDFGPRVNTIADRKQVYGISSPPLTPLAGERDETVVLAVQPNDRGKATALGAFSKPVQPYDENKYSQRQLQMQQGGETPPPGPLRGFVPRQPNNGRNRGDSNASFATGRSRSNSSVQRQFFPQDRVQEIQISHAEEEEAVEPGTFLSSPNNSSVGDAEPEVQPRFAMKPSDLYNKYRQDHGSPVEPPESQHPANRQRPIDIQTLRSGGDSPSIPLPHLRIEESPPRSAPASDPLDSPTLGPTSGGLSGMVRQHLRSDSDKSSIYGGLQSDGLTSRFPRDTMEPSYTSDFSTKNSPWDTNDWDRQSDYGESSFSLEKELESVKAYENVPPPVAAIPMTSEAVQVDRKSPWEKELETHHSRDASSDTQKEQNEFKMDLAARRRRVQENLKSFVETESRSASPSLGGPDWPKEGHLRNNPLGMLRSKTSRGSLVVRQKESGQSKAMKMLGIGSATISSTPSPGKQSFDEPSWKEEEESMLRSVNKSHTAPIIPPQTKAFRQARRDAQRDREREVASRHNQNGYDMSNNPHYGYGGPGNDRAPSNIRTQRTPSHERGPPPVSNRTHRNAGSQESHGSVGTKSSGGSRSPSRATRDRSSSDASTHSRNRNGRHNEGLPNTTQDGLLPPAGKFQPRSPGLVSPGLPFSPSNGPSPRIAVNSTSQTQNNSKSGYFASHNLQPLQTGDGYEIGLSPRPSPVTPFSLNSTPALIPRSPATTPGVAGSGASTPTNQGFQPQTRVPGARKFSVNKSDISEPTFLSSTSRITVVNLPPGASLNNGTEVNAPPIPPVNPRRKTRAMFGFGKKGDLDVDYSLPAATQSTEEMSTFSADEETKPRVRQKLRKSSSEGGSLNAKARQAINAGAPSPAMPVHPPGPGSPAAMF